MTLAGILVLGYGHIVKMRYFCSSCLHWVMDQKKLVYSNKDQEGSYKIVNFTIEGLRSYARA